jgi:hypothetical protein
MIRLPSQPYAAPRPLRVALRRLWILPLLGGLFAGCSTTPSEAIGTSAEALSCGGSVGDWTDFPYGAAGQSCVTGVIDFYRARFGAPLPGSVGPCGAPYGDDGACNYWVTESSWPSHAYPGVWDRFAWGSETPRTYDMVVFTSNPSHFGTAFGHVASVDHVASDGTLYVTDSNWNGSGHGECPHPVSWAPYGFYRLKALELPPAKGSLDSVTCQSLQGSAEDPSAPSADIAVDFYLDGPKGSGTSLGSVQTDSSHEFSMAPPLSLYDGHAHSIYAYAVPVTSGAGEGLLTNAPATLHCAAPLSGDFHGTGRDDIVEFRDDWTTFSACGQWGSVWSCNDDAATYVGGVSAGNGGSGIFAGATALIGDMNGDGRSDVIEWDSASSSIHVCFSIDHGWACENLPASYVGGAGAGNAGSGVFTGASAFAADVNGDGKADLVEFDPTRATIPVCFSTEQGWACKNLPATYLGGRGAGNGGSGVYGAAAGSVTTALVGDVNGDGKADLVQWNPSWTTIPECLATSEGWSCINASATYVGGSAAGNAGSGVYPAAWTRLADVNGDGKADLVQFDPTSTTIPVCFSTDSGWSCEDLAATYIGGGEAGNGGSGVYPATTIISADLNGDGRADILQYVAGAARLPVCFSTGRGWSCQNMAVSPTTADAALPYGLPVVGRLEGDKGMAVAQVTPEGSSGILRTCAFENTMWSCSNDVADMK